MSSGRCSRCAPACPPTAAKPWPSSSPQLIEQLADKGIVTRGLYDVAGFRADADLMIWWVAPTSDDLQEAWSRFRQTALGRACEPVWSAMALHRPAEFNKSHVPGLPLG